jgi:two-component system NarL family sensor kinase
MANEIRNLIIISTFIFLIAPAFIIMFMVLYNQRKKRHIEEKVNMKLTFDAELTKTQLEVQEQTMQTIGADLHDNIGQLLSLTSLTLSSIELQNIDKSKQKIEAAIDLTKKSIKEMRLLGKLLQGDQLIAMGLPEAIRYEINWLEKAGQYQITYSQECDMPAASNPDKDLILFRILQEILNNIIKHSRSTLINIKLEFEDSFIHLNIEDNGVGFNADHLSAGMGLRNMHKRAAIVGGNIKIDSKPGVGTNIAILIPYP